MTVRLLALPLLSAMSLFVLPVLAEQPKEQADDPLPKNALVRFGITRPILRGGPSVALIPPMYTNFLAPTMTGGIRRYDVGTGRPLDKKGIVDAGQVVVSADGKRAAVARMGSVSVVEVETGKLLLAVNAPEGVIIAGVPGVSLSGDGKLLAFGGKGQDIRGEVVVIDVDMNEVVAQCETNQAAPVYPLLSRDGKTLVTFGPPPPPITLGPPATPKVKAPDVPDEARTAQVWEVASGRELFKARVTGMGGNVVTAAMSPDGNLLAISAADGPVDLFDIKTGQRLHTLLGRKAQGVCVAISPDGKKVASIGPDYRIQQWQSDGKPLGISDAPPGLLIAPITALKYADNERVIAWNTAALFCIAWEAPTGKLLSPLMDHQAAIRSIAYPDGGAKDLLSSGYDGKAFRWDVATGALGEEIHFQPARIPGAAMIRPVVALSGDGTRAVWQRTPSEVFDVATGDNRYVIPPPSSPPAPAIFGSSPDGMKVIVTSRQAAKRRTGSCVVWDLMTQQRVAEFDIVPSASAAAPLGVLSPSGNRLIVATASSRPEGGQALLIVGYDLKTGKKLAEVEDTTGVGNMTVSIAAANDTTVVVASNLGRIWSVDYANGRIEENIDKVPVQGEPPLAGPVVFSPDGKRFATGIVGEPFTTYGIRVYDLATKKALHTFIGHAGPVTAIRFSPDGNAVASGAQDTSVLLWDLTKLANDK
jgi:WD40 repeat protein